MTVLFTISLLNLVIAQESASTSTLWINEFHYDNGGTDIGEFIEIAGIHGTYLSNYDLYLYSGSTRQIYDGPLSSFNVATIPNQESGIGVAYINITQLQNGGAYPDGIALVFEQATVVQFISYEGTFTAEGGPADSLRSVDIGVTQTSSTSEGTSISLSGTGNQYDDFHWVAGVQATAGGVNVNQIIPSTTTTAPTTTTSTTTTTASSTAASTTATTTIASSTISTASTMDPISIITTQPIAIGISTTIDAVILSTDWKTIYRNTIMDLTVSDTIDNIQRTVAMTTKDESFWNTVIAFMAGVTITCCVVSLMIWIMRKYDEHGQKTNSAMMNDARDLEFAFTDRNNRCSQQIEPVNDSHDDPCETANIAEDEFVVVGDDEKMDTCGDGEDSAIITAKWTMTEGSPNNC